jgi:hypothetical protein
MTARDILTGVFIVYSFALTTAGFAGMLSFWTIIAGWLLFVLLLSVLALIYGPDSP